jgi:hypothetical protein
MGRFVHRERSQRNEEFVHREGHALQRNEEFVRRERKEIKEG